ncbi:MAG: hypothetical protein F6K36_27755 [Symploca sp. SIO3C6]|nr:hypothetical protein [Symploca sp. SIO3C6]
MKIFQPIRKSLCITSAAIGLTTVNVSVGTMAIVSSTRQMSAEAGTRYVYPADDSQGTIRNINSAEVVQSKTVESFLDTTNWSKDVTSLIEKFPQTLIAETSLTLEQQEILNVHNQLREEVGVPSLRWSDQLASYAQDWANQLSQENGIRHRNSGSMEVGENIAAGSSVTQMLDLWSKEKDNYNHSRNTCRQGQNCGHYTQMVWKNTTEIGCGVASHRIYGNVMVCDYSPPGNYIGERPY